jgi:hypothetical protein
MDDNDIARLVSMLREFSDDMKTQFKDFHTKMNKVIDRTESIIKGLKIESETEKEILEKKPTINTYIDEFNSELENSCVSNDNNNLQSSSMALDEIDEFLNSLSIDESPKVLGDSQVEWDDVIIFDHDNFDFTAEVDVSIIYPNSYDIVPLDNDLIVTMQPCEVESVDVDHNDSEMELNTYNTFEVQKLPSNSTKIGEKNIFAVRADEQVLAVVFEAVSEVSFKDTGDSMRRVWDPGVCNSDGRDFLSI